MSGDRRYFLIGGLLGAFFLVSGYYLLWVRGNDIGWVFLALAVVNYLRVQRRVRTR
jgi:uncharacterized membrane protein YdcZ (DUF606 family)